MKRVFTLSHVTTAFFVFTMLLLAQLCQAQVAGTVFKDFNYNGTQQTSGFPTEPGVYGVTVRAYNSANVLLATKTTSAAGAYSFTAGEIPSGTAVRIEFTNALGAFNARSGTGNGTDIQFVTGGALVTANYAIASQDWYSNTANPYIATNGATNGDPLGGGTAGTNNNLYVFPWDMGNGTPNDGGASRRLANSQLGAVFSISFQRATRTLLMAAYLKRHVGFGPNGIGAIYKSTVDATGVPAAASLLVNVSGLGGINVGTNPRTVALPAAAITRNADAGVFAEVGKRGIGGADLGDDGRDLYFVNMFEKKLHRINIGNPIKATITAADVTGTWTITDPGIAGTSWRPMACKTANGKVYVGGVTVRETTSAHNLATDTVGSRAIVYEFDPATGAFTEVLRFGLNYRRGYSNGDLRFPFRNNWWCGWQNNGNGSAASAGGAPLLAGYNTAAGATFTGGIYYAQPMLSDIEFDVDGSMIVAIRDRFGDQVGYQNLGDDGQPSGGFDVGTNFFRGLTSGEVLRAGKNIAGSAFTIESLGAATTNGVTTSSIGVATTNATLAATDSWIPTASGTPYGGPYGPGWGGTGTTPAGGPNPGTQGGYFYYNHNYNTVGTPGTLNSGATAINAHYLKSVGGIALLAGSNELAHTAMDPVTTAFANGAGKFNNSGAAAGNMSQRLQLVSTVTNDPGNMGKSNGLGDLEILNDYQPIEVGNRIWNDADGNGLQDAGEAGINGVTVDLVSPGPNGIFGDGDDVVVATTTTATVNGQAGSYFFSTLTTADARKPAGFTGVGANDILPGFNYQVRIPNATGGSQQVPLAGFRPTTADAGANTLDNLDNDGTSSGTSAVALFNSFNTSHSFDFGFKTSAALGDRVWRDDDADGTQDAGEPGVAGVQVTLFRDLNNDGDFLDAGENNPFAATVTDAYGNYFFDNLPVGNYQVQITPPANYSITTQTNTADNELAGATTGSDVNATTGRSYTVVLSAGETERDIDAGLIFNIPAATANIGDRVWLDTDQDGVQDAGEPGLAGVTVTLYNSAGVAVATTVTDANGNYLFQNVTPGAGYRVGFTPPAGMVFSPKDVTTGGGNDNTDSDVNTAAGVNFGKTDPFTVVAGTNNLTLDAGLSPQGVGKASLGDFVWNDIDQDGIQDAGEPGVPGVTVQLLNNAGTVIATVVTDAFGKYQFNDLNPGTYGVRFTLPGGYAFSPFNVGTNDFINSDAGRGANANESQGVSLNAGNNNPSIDAGIYQTAPAGTSRIGDKVWFDTDKDGIQDATEPGVPGVTVTLFNSAGTAIATTVTDANGNYTFANLANGTYTVGFSNLPAGYGFTTKDQTAGGGTDTNDNDADPATGRTANIVISAPGTVITTVDAGLVPGQPSGKGSLGNKVWYDLDNDGLQDAVEGGVPGVTVTLQKDLNNDGDFADPGEAAFATTTTNAIGEYMFFNLDAGSYRVQFSTLPTAYTAATQDAGADDTKDSDGGTITGGISTTGVYSLAQGEDNLSVDLGIVNAARNTVGDKVWLDVDGDGVQDANEPGVAGVTVTLLDGSGNIYDSDLGTAGIQPLVTTTDFNGNYIFSNLPDGSYSVQFSNLPNGLAFTAKDQTAGGGNDTNDSDADALTGKTASVALAAGNRINTTLDAGLRPVTTAMLGNYVWIDENGDGVQDAGEVPVPGVTVSLFFDANNDGDFLDAGENLPVASMITNQNGEYLFGNLTPGNYQVGFSTVPGGLSYTRQNTPGDNGNNTNSDADNTGRTGTITLTAGEADLSVDGGLTRPTASVGDFVWFDTNNDGIQQSTEGGIPGVIATLYDASNNVIGSAVTDGSGRYLINNVPPGNGYYIIFTNKPAGSFTTQNVGGTGATDNSKADAAGRTTAFNVASGQFVSNIDAGVFPLATLPVRFLSFTAEKRNSSSVLNWTVAGEQAGMKYKVERSVDGVNFTELGVVNSNAANNGSYSFTDNTPVANVKNYYRIRQTDVNGRAAISEIRWVRFDGDVKLDIYPNPAVDVISITFGQELLSKPLTIELYSADGKQVMRKQTDRSNATEQLNVATLAAGSYQLRIISNGEVKAVKQIVKQ
jgi:protocatechuate 3,4-dioxygenase beta subunit